MFTPCSHHSSKQVWQLSSKWWLRDSGSSPFWVCCPLGPSWSPLRIIWTELTSKQGEVKQRVLWRFWVRGMEVACLTSSCVLWAFARGLGDAVSVLSAVDTVAVSDTVMRVGKRIYWRWRRKIVKEFARGTLPCTTASHTDDWCLREHRGLVVGVFFKVGSQGACSACAQVSDWL